MNLLSKLKSSVAPNQTGAMVTQAMWRYQTRVFSNSFLIHTTCIHTEMMHHMLCTYVLETEQKFEHDLFTALHVEGNPLQTKAGKKRGLQLVLDSSSGNVTVRAKPEFS